MDQELKAKLAITENNIESMLNSLENFTGLEVKDLGLMRDKNGKLQVLILMWRGKDAKGKEV